MIVWIELIGFLALIAFAVAMHPVVPPGTITMMFVLFGAAILARRMARR